MTVVVDFETTKDRQLLNQLYERCGQTQSLESYRAHRKELIRQGGAALSLVARVSGVFLGHCGILYTRTGGQMFGIVTCLFVDPAQRSRGIGKKLLLEAGYEARIDRAQALVGPGAEGVWGASRFRAGQAPDDVARRAQELAGAYRGLTEHGVRRLRRPRLA